jgi:hypothetical protein
MKIKEISRILFIACIAIMAACASDSTSGSNDNNDSEKSEKKEIQKDSVNDNSKIERPAAEAIPAPMPPADGECSENLKLFEQKVKTMLDLGEKRSQGDKSEETMNELKSLDTELRELAETIENAKENGTSVRCAKIWLQSFTRYANFIHENWADFN